MFLFKSPVLVLLYASIASATPCPYGDLAERGLLPESEAKKFFAAREAGPDSSVHLDKRAEELQKREFAAQEKFFKRQIAQGLLPNGGGLLNGLLQPLTGALSGLDLPTPQEFSLAIIPDAAHPYIAPERSAVRGMCPTLNTMANHGYISRDGITTFAEAANACQITLGFGYDTCVFLSALGLLAGGDLISGKYSIGGADARVPNTLGPSLGISKHGFFEVDNSISRLDQGVGNQANFNLPRFQRIMDLTQKYNGQFGNSLWADERVLVYNEAKNNNPTFNAGVRWLAVTTAERVFIFRAMPNGTDLGNADFANVLPFYLNETFPEHWFRRPTPYSLVNTGTDIATLLATSSELTVPGQNQGLGNFVPLGLDIGSVSPASASCFLASAIFDETPGFLAPGLVTGFELVNAFLQAVVAPFFAPFDCPSMTFSDPGPNAGNSEPGVSTTENILVNGMYE